MRELKQLMGMEYMSAIIADKDKHIAWQEGEIARLKADLQASVECDNVLREALAALDDSEVQPEGFRNEDDVILAITFVREEKPIGSS